MPKKEGVEGVYGSRPWFLGTQIHICDSTFPQ